MMIPTFQVKSAEHIKDRSFPVIPPGRMYQLMSQCSHPWCLCHHVICHMRVVRHRVLQVSLLPKAVTMILFLVVWFRPLTKCYLQAQEVNNYSGTRIYYLIYFGDTNPSTLGVQTHVINAVSTQLFPMYNIFPNHVLCIYVSQTYFVI